MPDASWSPCSHIYTHTRAPRRGWACSRDVRGARLLPSRRAAWASPRGRGGGGVCLGNGRDPRAGCPHRGVGAPVGRGRDALVLGQRRASAPQAQLWFALTPAFGATWAYLVLGEQYTFHQVTAAFLLGAIALRFRRGVAAGLGSSGMAPGAASGPSDNHLMSVRNKRGGTSELPGFHNCFSQFARCEDSYRSTLPEAPREETAPQTFSCGALSCLGFLLLLLLLPFARARGPRGASVFF